MTSDGRRRREKVESTGGRIHETTGRNFPHQIGLTGDEKESSEDISLYCLSVLEREPCTVGEGDKKRLLVFEAWCCSRLLKIIWTEMLTNEEYLRERKKLETSCGSINFSGPILRRNGLMKLIGKGINYKRTPSPEYIYQVSTDTKCDTYWKFSMYFHAVR